MMLILSQEAYILCRLYQCRIEDVLLFYMKQVNIDRLLIARAHTTTTLATAFLYHCAEKE